ncbi:MAG TPA: M17 family metallopeptidase, partial [Ilumatobacter sp.]|nr:M17 family metallopeptidase [Ilumatobacter sp.]
VKVLDEKALAKAGFGGIVGVGQGSSRPPRLVQMTYSSGKRRGVKKVALVGKGVTFDTGGISIKPAAGMENMTSDMGGAAAVVATVVLAAKLRLPVDVTAWVPMAENMPSATAQRPGDVLTQYGGTTVEVINTDAEGRLILADGLALATEAEPDAIVDVATLTGSALAALGEGWAAVFGSDPALVDRLRASADATDEAVWELPLSKAKYRSQIDSPVADLKNIGGAYAGAIIAAIFLSEFVGDTPWAHLDIAGTMHSDGNTSWRSKGATGFGTRLLIDLVTTY